MRADNPDICVIIPAFNAAATIESSIASIQQQTVDNIVILVINDGSTDATSDIIDVLAAGDTRIRHVKQQNSGIVDALNNGLRISNAKYIARHDADDVAFPNRFEIQLAYLEANADCVAVSSAVRHVDQIGRLLKARASLPSPDLADPAHFPQIEPYLIHPFLMMRSSALEKIGNYRYVFHAEDTDLYWRLQDVGRLYNISDVLGDYRIHSGSISGASIVNGRVSAINSQRSGLSEMRRRSGEKDITFPKAWLLEYENAVSLEGMLRIASRDLTTSETEILALSAGLKLLEAAGYRPFEVEYDDCVFLKKAYLTSGHRLTPKNRSLSVRMITGAAARLIQNGKLSSAYALAPANLLPLVAARLILRAAFLKHVRKLLQKAVGRDNTFVK